MDLNKTLSDFMQQRLYIIVYRIICYRHLDSWHSYWITRVVPLPAKSRPIDDLGPRNQDAGAIPLLQIKPLKKQL
jgi:hypothetical protein